MSNRCAPLEHRVDVLVVGGGIAGLVAAIRARSAGLTVMIADKGTVGWSGQAGMSGGFAWLVPPDEDPGEFVQWLAAKGEYLCNQIHARAIADRSYQAIGELIRWGIPFDRDDRGRPRVLHHDVFPAMLAGTTFTPIDILRSLAQLARERGVRWLDKTPLVEPLLEQGRLVGAAGFDVLSATPVVVLAGATVLASGSCDYAAERLTRASTGEGIRLAWRAGARVRNAEFGNLYNPKLKIWDGPFRGFLASHIRNAKGELLRELYQYPGAGEELGILLVGMARELAEGRGPCTVDFAEIPRQEDPLSPQGDHPLNPQRLIAKFTARDPSELSARQEVALGFVGKVSPVSVDLDYRTDVPGLFAVGDVSHLGCAWEGALPGGSLPGTSITYAVVSALDAGAAVAEEARPPAQCGTAVSRAAVASVMAALHRSSGVLPDELIRAVQRIMCPVGANMIRGGKRLESMAARLGELREGAGDLCAHDGHGLAKCHQAQSILLAAELTTRAALLRTESRGSHLREDFPDPDDAHWLKWIVLRARGKEVDCEFERVPMERYPCPLAERRSPWGRYHEPRPRRSNAPKGRRSGPARPPRLELGALRLRDLEDRRVSLDQHRGRVVVLLAATQRAAEESSRWTLALQDKLAGTAGVELYRVAIVELPPYVPRVLVKRQLRRKAGSLPFLVAWDEQERASLPFEQDALPHVLVFARSGELRLHLADVVSKKNLERIVGLAQGPDTEDR